MRYRTETYTGYLDYRNVRFTFVFDKKELRLIPPVEKSYEVENWFCETIAPGLSSAHSCIALEDDYLKGYCNETEQYIIFFTASNKIYSFNSVLKMNIGAYIIFSFNDQIPFNRISFVPKELDYIYPSSQAIHASGVTDDGKILVATTAFDATTSEKYEFLVNGKKVSVYFSISRNLTRTINQSPISLFSVMSFEFEPTDDYMFIIQLWKIARDFLHYLCYRRNVEINEVALYSTLNGEKSSHSADLFFVPNELPIEMDLMYRGKYINLSHIPNSIGNILTAIADNTLYLRHLPETGKMGNRIDAARFIMITAAFEWEFRRIYPNGVQKKEKTLQAEEEAEKQLGVLFENSKGKLREIYRFLRKLVSNSSLQAEIEQASADFSNALEKVTNRLYRLNNRTFNPSAVGERLAKQRNNFAHGNLDKDFDVEASLDIFYMQYLVYAMQLRRFGVDDALIHQAINNLFACGA